MSGSSPLSTRAAVRSLSLLVALAACGENEDRAGTEPYYQPFECRDGGEVTRTPLSLQSPELQPWLERVSGHHEASLAWRMLDFTDRARGYSEHTTLSMDVTVLSAEDYVYTPDSDSECQRASQRALHAEVQLATSDGAFAGSFRHWLVFYPSFQDGAAWLESNQVVSLALDSVASTFELGSDPRDEVPGSGAGLLRVFFSFQEAGIRGSLQPEIVAPPDANGYRRSWAPVEATFPYPCSEGEALDRVWEELGGVPRELYAAYASRWPTGPLAALYVDPETFPARVDPLAETQLTLSVGPLTRVCDIPDLGLHFFGPVRLDTSDGRVRYEQEMMTNRQLGSATARSPRALPSDLESVLGIQGADLGGVQRGHVELHNDFGYQNVEMFGGLRVFAPSLEAESRATPALIWCAGREGCAPEPK